MLQNPLIWKKFPARWELQVGETHLTDASSPGLETLNPGYRGGGQEGQCGICPQHTCGFGGLYQGMPGTWHLVADQQVPGLGRWVAPASLGCNFIAGIECVHAFSLCGSFRRSLPGG